MSVMEQDSAGAPARASLLNDPKVSWLFSISFVLVVLLVIFVGYVIVTEHNR